MANNPRIREANTTIGQKREGAFTPVGTHQTDATVSASTELFPNTTLADELEDMVNCVLLQCDSQNIRFTLDGTTPTASVGFLLPAGSPALLIYLSGDTELKVIEVAASATIQFQYGRVVER